MTWQVLRPVRPSVDDRILGVPYVNVAFARQTHYRFDCRGPRALETASAPVVASFETRLRTKRLERTCCSRASPVSWGKAKCTLGNQQIPHRGFFVTILRAKKKAAQGAASYENA